MHHDIIPALTASIIQLSAPAGFEILCGYGKPDRDPQDQRGVIVRNISVAIHIRSTINILILESSAVLP